MAITVGEIESDVLHMLQKSPGYQGIYTEEKIKMAIQDSIDYIAVEQMLGDDSWNSKIVYLPVEEGKHSTPIPGYVGMIHEVRYKVVSEYLPLLYDTHAMAAQYTRDSGYTQYPSRYRIVDNEFYFNPIPSITADDAIQLEYHGYPERILESGQQLERNFDFAMRHYIKYRAASILASMTGREVKEWTKYEEQWQYRLNQLLNRRVKTTVYVKDFDP